MLRIRRLSAFLFAAALSSAVLGAEPALRPVPTPDLGRLPAARANELRSARAAFEKAKEFQNGDALAESYALLAGVYARNGFYAEAAVALADAALLAPTNGQWAYAQGIVASRARPDADATSYFERAAALNPNYLPAIAALADRRIAAGDLDGARRALEGFTAHHHDQAVPYAMLGDVAMRQKRYADAVAQFNQALRLDPSANLLYAKLADAYAAAGDAKAAAAARAKAGKAAPALFDPVGSRFLAATPAAPADPKARAAAEVMSLVAARRYADARTRLDGALKAAPNDANLLALYARVEAVAGNLPAAQSRAAAALAADPNNAVAHLSQGMVREMSNDDAGAQRAYADAIRLDAKLDGAYVALGNLLMRTGRLDEAAAQYRALVQAEPANADGWARLVAAEVAQGRCADALKELNRGLAKAPNDANLLQFFVRVASTCTAAGADQKRTALDYGGKLYKGSSAAPVAEAYALALGANGRWDDAVKTQQGAVFVALRNEGQAGIGPYREILQQLQAHKLPDRPWAASADVFHPARPQPDVAAAAAPPKR
ncbi:MAG TPA: tetratricopeptide repeat protein [Dokdonella sp.]